MGMYDITPTPMPIFAIGDEVIKPNGESAKIIAIVVNNPSRWVYYTGIDDGYFAEELRAA